MRAYSFLPVGVRPLWARTGHYALVELWPTQPGGVIGIVVGTEAIPSLGQAERVRRHIEEIYSERSEGTAA